jgi:hypothetical protein
MENKPLSQTSPHPTEEAPRTRETGSPQPDTNGGSKSDRKMLRPDQAPPRASQE